VPTEELNLAGRIARKSGWACEKCSLDQENTGKNTTPGRIGETGGRRHTTTVSAKEGEGKNTETRESGK